jgi:hypothetical protein
MINDSAHVKIGSVTYVIAEDEEPHYNHSFESLFAPASSIAGEIAKDQLRPEKILWSITDWIGGEGGRIYYPQDPTRYDLASLMNPTVRGQLTTRTERRRSAVARAGANADTASRPAGISTYGSALIAWEDNIIASTDAITWASAQDVTPAMSGASYADAIADGINAAFLPSAGGAADAIPVVTADVATNAWADAQTGTEPNPPMVAAVLNGVPYTLGETGTQFKLLKKDTIMDDAGNWGATIVFDTDIIPGGTWGTNHWTSIVSAETALYFSFSTLSTGYIWELRADIGRPFWTAPPGFVIKKLIYQQGVLFILGNRQAAGKQFAELHAIPLQTQSPDLIASPRKHQNTEVKDFSIGCAGPDAYLFCADATSGKIFLYDIRNDGLHLFDDLANGGTGDGMDFVVGTDKLAFLAMHGSRLFGATWEPSTGADTSLQVFSYDDLEPANRDDSQAISATLETAEWDMGLPMELKALNGFYVTFKVTDSGTTSGLVANSRIKISYSTDDSAYTDLTVITSATTPTGAKGRVFQQVSTGSSTVLFSRLKVKITLDNNSTAVAPPIVFSVVADTQPMAYAEYWDMVVRVEDENSNERPLSRANDGSFLRDNLEDLATNKSIVTLLDGYRYQQPDRYTTHTVMVEQIGDDIRTLGEGVMRVRMRAIA